MDTGDVPAATMVVTGGNTGIGLEMAVGLAGRGARMVITASDPERGAWAVTAIRQRSGSDRVDVLPLDLASFGSVRSFASVFPATSPEVEGVSGSYSSRCRVEPLTGLASDRKAARRLWDESGRLIAGHPGEGPGRPE